jgi:hypothetical protein
LESWRLGGLKVEEVEEVEEVEKLKVEKLKVEKLKVERLEVGGWRLDVGCWMLDVGCWMLDVGCWMLDVGCWMLDVGCWMLEVGIRKVSLFFTRGFCFDGVAPGRYHFSFFVVYDEFSAACFSNRCGNVNSAFLIIGDNCNIL